MEMVIVVNFTIVGTRFRRNPILSATEKLAAIASSLPQCCGLQILSYYPPHFFRHKQPSLSIYLGVDFCGNIHDPRSA